MRRIVDWTSPQPHIAVPWKKCEVHDFVFLYASMCPCCLADAAESERRLREQR